VYDTSGRSRTGDPYRSPMIPTYTSDCATMATHMLAGEASRAAKYAMSVTACRARSKASTAAATNEPGSVCLPRSEVWLRKTRNGALAQVSDSRDMPTESTLPSLRLPDLRRPAYRRWHRSSEALVACGRGGRPAGIHTESVSTDTPNSR
jgi:hypothetical protein